MTSFLATVFFAQCSLVGSAFGAIKLDFNCTYYDAATQTFSYLPSATSCSNWASDASCKLQYPQTSSAGFPTAFGDQERPYQCYNPEPGQGISDDYKSDAINLCPKTCGYCCQTNAYSTCKDDADFNCAFVTAAQCNDPTWKAILLSKCPSSCGFCGEIQCIDKVTICTQELCEAQGMADFAKVNCKKTCGFCGYVVADPCQTYNPDKSTSCKVWKEQGFCTSTFYTLAQKKEYCATTCKIC